MMLLALEESLDLWSSASLRNETSRLAGEGLEPTHRRI